MPNPLVPPGYFDYAELSAALRQLESQHPQLVVLQSAGQSAEGREIWLVALTDRSTGEAAEKPAVWLDGNTHAAELAGTSVCLHVLRELAAAWASGDPSTGALLSDRALFAMPRVNPDGADFVLRTGAPLRAGTRFWPKPADEVAGFEPGDADGDGRTLQMRVESEWGPWKCWSEDVRVLVPREAGDTEGPFYELYREGVFLGAFDPDRLEVPAPRRGTDFNRNYPYGYRPEYAQKGAGDYPLCEPETRAHIAAVVARPRISAAVSYHTYCGALIRPFSDKPDTMMDAADLALFEAVGRVGERTLGYKSISAFHEFRYSDTDTISGAFDDWAYNDRGLLAWTVEIWNIATAAGLKLDDLAGFFFRGRRTPEQTAAVLQWAVDHCDGGYVDWYPFEHPQLGPVELGGFNRLWSWQNPPPAELERECRQHLDFVRALLQSVPRVRWKRVDVEPLAADPSVRRVRAVVENVGYLPSSATAHGRHFAPPVSAQIVLAEGCSLAAGSERVELGHLEGMQDVSLRPWADPAYFTGATRARVGVAEWIVRGAGPIRLAVEAGRAGRLEYRIG